jgi:hypothetical protein
MKKILKRFKDLENIENGDNSIVSIYNNFSNLLLDINLSHTQYFDFKPLLENVKTKNNSSLYSLITFPERIIMLLVTNKQALLLSDLYECGLSGLQLDSSDHAPQHESLSTFKILKKIFNMSHSITCKKILQAEKQYFGNHKKLEKVKSILDNINKENIALDKDTIYMIYSSLIERLNEPINNESLYVESFNVLKSIAANSGYKDNSILKLVIEESLSKNVPMIIINEEAIRNNKQIINTLVKSDYIDGFVRVRLDGAIKGYQQSFAEVFNSSLYDFDKLSDIKNSLVERNIINLNTYLNEFGLDVWKDYFLLENNGVQIFKNTDFYIGFQKAINFANYIEYNNKQLLDEYILKILSYETKEKDDGFIIENIKMCVINALNGGDRSAYVYKLDKKIQKEVVELSMSTIHQSLIKVLDYIKDCTLEQENELGLKNGLLGRNIWILRAFNLITKNIESAEQFGINCVEKELLELVKKYSVIDVEDFAKRQRSNLEYKLVEHQNYLNIKIDEYEIQNLMQVSVIKNKNMKF